MREAQIFNPFFTLVSHKVVYLNICEPVAMSADSCIWAPPTGAQIRLFTLELMADTASYGNVAELKLIHMLTDTGIQVFSLL